MTDWEDLERAALNDAHLHQCVHLAQLYGRERALIFTALALAKVKNDLLEEKRQALMNQKYGH